MLNLFRYFLMRLQSYPGILQCVASEIRVAQLQGQLALEFAITARHQFAPALECGSTHGDAPQSAKATCSRGRVSMTKGSVELAGPRGKRMPRSDLSISTSLTLLPVVSSKRACSTRPFAVTRKLNAIRYCPGTISALRQNAVRTVDWSNVSNSLLSGASGSTGVGEAELPASASRTYASRAVK